MALLLRRSMAWLSGVLLVAACDGGGTTPAPTGPAPALPTATLGVVATATAPSVLATATVGGVLPAGEANAQPGPGDGAIQQGALYHMSRDPLYRSPVGAVAAGSVVTLRLRTAVGDLTGATVRVWDSRAGAEQRVPLHLERRAADGDYWSVALQTPARPGTLYYRFLAQDGGAGAAYEDDRARDGGVGEAQSGPNDNDYLITVYDPHWTIPAWMQDAVIYQIFPDRFNNGDPSNDRPAGQPVYDGRSSRSAWEAPPQGNSDFYGGDLQGVINKLDYLQSLGVTVLYFNPIFDAASNHGYDTRDYNRLAAWFGDTATFDRLIVETKRRNMHLILDGVFNHTGSDSLYFDRYGHYPTDGAFESQASPYFGWFHFYKWPKWYNEFETYDTLPAFQETDAVRDFLFRRPDSVAQHWLAAGAAGWRLDAAKYKSDGFWRDFRTAVRATYPDAVIIGENWENAAGWLTGDAWDGVTNYRFRAAALGFMSPTGTTSATALDNLLASEREDYPPQAVQASMNIIDSHDVERALTSVGGDKNRLRLLALLQFTSAGAPTILYGDEAGLAGGADPDNRRTYPWGSADPDLIHFYQTLAQTRHALPALRTGSTTRLLVHDANRLYAFARQEGPTTAVVAFNLGGAAQTLDLAVQGVLADGAVLHDRLTNGTAYTVQGGHLVVPVGADWGALLVP